MKKLLLFAWLSLPALFQAQTYSSLNMTLSAVSNPQSTIFNDISPGQKYSGVWGWYQSSKNREYAIVGSVTGTYFIDVTIPTAPVVCDYVAGQCTSVWREIQTYQNYAYVVSDGYSPNSLQIIDLKYLPDSVHVKYDNNAYFENSHTVYIDGNKMYCGGVTYSNSAYSSMNVYSLATPTAPVLLRSLDQDYPAISAVHDMFVRNDTSFVSAGYQGLHVFKLTGSNTFTALGSLTTYAQSGYNHSSYLTPDGQNLFFCDEVPAALSIKSASVSNLGNISVSANFKPNNNADFVAHNPYIKEKWLFVSCYQDGIQLYDIANPTAPQLYGHFDTYPQGGVSNGNNYGSTSYMGNWGAYVFLPSGLILAGDMQNGLFILKTNIALENKENSAGTLQVGVYPNPVSERLYFSVNTVTPARFQVNIVNMLGENVLATETNCKEGLDVSSLSAGVYLLTLNSQGQHYQQKIVISR